LIPRERKAKVSDLLHVEGDELAVVAVASLALRTGRAVGLWVVRWAQRGAVIADALWVEWRVMYVN
jgi:hypothetical protein